MRVAFAGTPPFAARALEAIAAAGHSVVLVLTQPDRPAGRGLKLTPSAVAQAAAALSLPVERPPSLKAPEASAGLRAARPDVMVVAAYGLLLPPTVLDIPTRGCLNIHASLLPRWRGAAPIQRAILAGDGVTGVCIMQMEVGLDTGPVLLAREIPIAPTDTAGALTDRLAELGAEAILAALAQLDSLVPQPQDEKLTSYAAKISKAEARIDWTRSCEELDRQVRAFNPAPGAEGEVAGELLKVWRAEPVKGARGVAGTLIRPENGDLVIACGAGGLRLETIQKAGGRRMPAADFLRGRALGTASPRS